MTDVTRFGWRTGVVVVVVAVSVLVGMMVLARGSGEEPGPKGPSTPAMRQIDFAVWGGKEEVAAYQAVTDAYNESSEDTSVTLSSWPDAAAMLDAMRDGDAKPDIYLLPRSELGETITEGLNRPLLDLVTEREIPLGDDFSREAVAAFSVEDDLQCLPYTVSPMVIYYNTRLVDFEAMDARGLPTPKPDHSGWNLAEFRAAAEFASRPRQGTRGVHIEPTLRGLAPFIHSGGGQVFNDEVDPTSLELGEDGSTDALRQTLELLRDPRLTLSSKQLAQRTAVEWFKRGRVAMIAGFRDLTPQLRKVTGLEFDVMPMPSLGSNRTVGELTGICLAPSGKPSRVDAAANFLTYLVSDDAIGDLASTGYLQPAKLTVALADDFLQPEQAPEHAGVFTDSVRDVVLPPLMQQSGALQALINPEIEALLTTPVLDDLQESLRAIDEKSRSLLDPDYEAPSESPSAASPTSSASPSDDRG